MIETVLHYAKIVASDIVFLILAWIIINFMFWLVEALIRQVLIFIGWSLRQMMRGTTQLGLFLKSLICAGAFVVFGLIWGTCLRVYRPCLLALQRFSDAVRQYMNMEPSKERNDRPATPEKSAYEQALAALGFAEDQVFDKAQLKARYRELAAILHPDKGFPNHVFMQQINDAVDCIKRAKKWR